MGSTTQGAGLQLREPAHHVSPRAVLFWTVRAVWGWLVLVVGQAVWLVLDAEDARGWRVLALVVTLVLAAAHLLVMPRWRYRVHRWEATPTAVYTQSGWFNQERRIAPLSRIQTVDMERGPLEQLFRLANVTVTTASAAGPLHINGLDHETAERLVRDLTVATEQVPGDAT
ncbi:MAG TPA: PH domain-containing protein [Segeticoccus sp.]|uniref:PH domain-containing protein n=1 Tax=Segeticoccus sp. TaxID=2706531 RepID=UPI002D80BCBF|nr:PH domain-containing protein [Segeticoccus sp.]HET8600425.1 PH domain-containing protein [Segeticoccus sp.]